MGRRLSRSIDTPAKAPFSLAPQLRKTAELLRPWVKLFSRYAPPPSPWREAARGFEAVYSEIQVFLVLRAMPWPGTSSCFTQCRLLRTRRLKCHQKRPILKALQKAKDREHRHPKHGPRTASRISNTTRPAEGSQPTHIGCQRHGQLPSSSRKPPNCRLPARSCWHRDRLLKGTNIGTCFCMSGVEFACRVLKSSI